MSKCLNRSATETKLLHLEVLKLHFKLFEKLCIVDLVLVYRALFKGVVTQLSKIQNEHLSSAV